MTEEIFGYVVGYYVYDENEKQSKHEVFAKDRQTAYAWLASEGYIEQGWVTPLKFKEGE